LPITVVDDYADTVLAQQLSQISGVGQILIMGEQKPAVRIQVDPAKISSLGISLEDIRTVINTATVDAPKGIFDEARRAPLRQCKGGAPTSLHGSYARTPISPAAAAVMLAARRRAK
jgi:multidrug efflux pump subunit AcrB